MNANRYCVSPAARIGRPSASAAANFEDGRPDRRLALARSEHIHRLQGDLITHPL